jgi:hypothetical protein
MKLVKGETNTLVLEIAEASFCDSRLKKPCHASRYKVAACQAFVVGCKRILRLISCIARTVPKLLSNGFHPGSVYIAPSDHDNDHKNDEMAEEFLQNLMR